MALQLDLPPSPAQDLPPSSRSERLLRDTLRKADQRRPALSRRNSTASSSSPSPPRRHRPSYSLSAVPIPRPAAAASPAPSPAASLAHDALLRSRLEHALGRVVSAPHPACPHPRPHHGRTRSLAASPAVSPASDDAWPWPPADDDGPLAPLTPPPTPPSARTPLGPATPPSPFNARAASQICRQLPGYVSFQDVEGLGEPPADDDAADVADPAAPADDDDRRWWTWPWRARAQTQ